MNKEIPVLPLPPCFFIVTAVSVMMMWVCVAFELLLLFLFGRRCGMLKYFFIYINYKHRTHGSQESKKLILKYFKLYCT